MTIVAPCTARVKSHFLGHLQTLLPADRIDQSLRDAGYHFRLRKLSPGRSVHLLLLQLLHRTALQGLRHLHDARLTASAICQARAKLPVSLFYLLIEQFAAVVLAQAAVPAEALFHGLQVVLLDATSVRTHDTTELAAHYGKHSNGRQITPGYPAPKLLCLMNCATGMIVRAIDLPAWRQEHMVLRRLLEYLQPGQIVVGDRGFVSFSFLCELLQIQVQACLRLPLRHRAKDRGIRRVLQHLGPGDRLVQWGKPLRRTKAYSQQAFDALAQSLTLREITYQVTREGFRPKSITLITTLLDPVQYPARDLAELYLQRWQIEIYFRDLKRTQGLLHLTAKTHAGVRKELLAHVLLYNLIRAVMLQAAQHQDVPAQRLSFIDALRHLRHAAQAGEGQGLVVNPLRDRPTEPRRVKTRRSKYPPLNKPRSLYKNTLEKCAA